MEVLTQGGCRGAAMWAIHNLRPPSFSIQAADLTYLLPGQRTVSEMQV